MAQIILFSIKMAFSGLLFALLSTDVSLMLLTRFHIMPFVRPNKRQVILLS